MNDSVQGSQQDMERSKILAWLSLKTDFPAMQREILSRKLRGTCEWFFENPVFKGWLDGTKKVLLCGGIPGAGKTIMASAVIEYLQHEFREEDVFIGFIYCNYQDGKTVTELLSILLGQLIQKHPVVRSEVRKLYKRHISGKVKPTASEYSSLLNSELAACSRAFIIVDALDECNYDDVNLSRFITEFQGLTRNTSILITSRPTRISVLFDFSYTLEIRTSQEDIMMYIENRINSHSRLTRLCQKDLDLQNEIKRSAKVQKTFLFAQFYMDFLEARMSPRSIRRAIAGSPRNLVAFYEYKIQMIQSQRHGDSKLAMTVLNWIVNAMRPLTIEELRYAIAVTPGYKEFEHDNLVEEESLISVCAGLVNVGQESKIVRLVHSTAQEYFRRAPPELSRGGDVLTATCLTYLSFDTFADGYCFSDEEMETRLKENPFLDYAAKHWGHHIREDPGLIMEGILDFVTQSSKLSSAVQVMCLPEDHSSGYSQVPPHADSILWVAAVFGLTEIVELILKRGLADVNESISNGETALHGAARNGYAAVAGKLLDCEVHAEAKDNGGSTALHLAAQNGHQTVVRMLLERGADAEAKDKGGWTALHWAARIGEEEVAVVLLKHGAIVEAKDNNGWTALHVAARNGHEAVVRRLLNCKAYIEAKDNAGWTALHMAAGPLLLNRGADSRVEAKIGWTALHRAAGNGNIGVVRTLLDMGADPMIRDWCGYTALHCAASNGHEEAVNMLLQRGVDPSTGDWYGQTALHCAAQNGHGAVANLLLMNNADKMAKDCSKVLGLYLSSVDHDDADV